ncbi:hypothetical protein JR316_0004884 [Psilocybe cubensis]|uniref:BTB domain-containing protein n=2 Tax=Psilocybe cubensis TaxID=181762 RepID=A0A8H7Y1B3_PSICU|nr:hypothetical protein JR316_0004884 [Psilocybe cubensis]KAH9482784.1 hypothetical protein JR316_0004884 [Psilocybe cubensis]
MSEHLRLTSPASSSPSRPPAVSRPDWPWVTRSYSHRSPHNSAHPILGPNLQSAWDPRTPYSSTSSQSGYTGNPQGRSSATPKPSAMGLGESTRQWTFTGFEWAIRDIHKLRDFVEGITSAPLEGGPHLLSADLGDFEILKQSPVLGDHKFKLEIVPTEASPEGSASSIPTLCMYITSLMLDLTQGDYETYASMMAAIKCQEDRVGERGARPEWVWEFWQNDWVFRRESEVWECPLPSLSSLLQNPRIRETDSFVIVVQIHSPSGPSIPQQPSIYYIPRDLLDGLEASLDNPNTGDVRFICLEKYTGSGDSPSLNSPQSGTSTTSSSSSPFGFHSAARKRIIYAHSDILIRRAEYFATMLSSSFSENSIGTTGERKVYTIVVEEAEFETMYWLLKYCYANWLLFKENDDPRIAVEGVGAGWSARWLSGTQDEWDWKRFHRRARPSIDSASDNKSSTSGDSLPVSSSISRSTSRKSDTYHPNSVSITNVISSQVSANSSRTNPTKSNPVSSNTSRPLNTSTPRKPVATSGTNHLSINASGRSSTLSGSKPLTISPSSNFSSTNQYSTSPRSSRKPGVISTSPDPHPHPTPAPRPASALSIYQIAHRYSMPNLATLALEHIMSTISPESSFALLLATSLWDELHSIIEDFVVERWDEVSASLEFEQCCKEVAAGEWGPDGGKTLMSVFRRLRSPSLP